MGLFDFLRKREDPADPHPDPIHDLVLSKLRPGYLLDHDLETWQVTAHHRYELDGEDTVEEWELLAGRQRVYLELEHDDGEHWSLSKKIPLGAIDGDVRRHILDNDDPPPRLRHDGVDYHLDESRAGYYFENGVGPRQELLKWDYVDGDEARTLTVEQWGEDDFEASVGKVVFPHQFTNILPGSPP
ncbi:MAG: DUF4178 domain-containing protein [Acidobacteriota bacterium]